MTQRSGGLPPVFPGITAVVLAAGEGRRFDPTGRRFKLIEPLPDGRPILRAACEALQPYVGEIVVVAGTRAPSIRAALEGMALRHEICPDAASGMAATIRCGVAASRPIAGWLVALGDMPFVAGDTIRRVCEALAGTVADGRGVSAVDDLGAPSDSGAAHSETAQSSPLIVRPFFQGRPGHPVAFAVSMRRELLQLDGEDGARQLIRRHAARLCRVDVADEGCTRDIDVASDVSSFYSG